MHKEDDKGKNLFIPGKIVRGTNILLCKSSICIELQNDFIVFDQIGTRTNDLPHSR
jgi:hypothetical protein